MKQGWEVKKIGEVLLVERGGSPRPIKKYLTNDVDGLNWIKISDATASSKYIYKTKQKITKDGLHKTRLVHEGDFLLSNSMSFGRPYIMKTSGCIHDGWLVLREKEEKLLDKDFLYFLLGSQYIFNQFDKLAAGSTVRNLNIALVKSVNIPIPPLSEQKQIVSILDKAFSTIDKAQANLEKNIANAEELFQSKLNEIFNQKGDGWVDKKLSEVCKIKPPKKIAKQKLSDDSLVSFVPMKNLGINQMYFTSDETRTLQKAYAGYVYFEENDVILAKITPCFENGKLGIATKLKNGIGFGSSEYIVYRTEKTILKPEFLYFFLNREIFRLKGAKLMSGAVGHKRIQPEFYENEVISFPNIVEQNEVCKQIIFIQNSINTLIEEYHKKITTLEELKKSLLKKAFTGELTKAMAEIIPFPNKVANISPTELQCGFIVLSYQKHEAAGTLNHFHAVKVEKGTHLIESHAGIDLDRTPVKDVAGPNDHIRVKKKVEPRAAKAGYFTVKKINGRIDYKMGKQSQKVLDKTLNILTDEQKQTVNHILDLLAKMKTQQAEIVATVYAAWNNLLIQKQEITDEAIVTAAREDWHESKLNIERERFFKAIEWMRRDDINLVPHGKGKLVKNKKT